MQKLQYEKTIVGFSEINELITQLNANNSIKATILFGSVARDEDNYHSDIDMSLWIEEAFNIKEFISDLENHFEDKIIRISNIPRKSSVVIFWENLKKIDLLLVKDITELNRNYLGSKIPTTLIADSILFDKTNQIVSHLKQLDVNKTELVDVYKVPYLVDYFIFAFESSSKYHAKSDGYLFYFNYNIALHTLIQLQYLLKGNRDFIYNPKNVTSHAWEKGKEDDLYKLKGTIFLPEANEQKRFLLNKFYQIVQELIPEELTSCKRICEAIYERDYFWNFRDYTIHNPELITAKIYRSAVLSIFDDTDKINQLLDQKDIQTIIDLRAPREVEALPHHQRVLKNRNYLKTPFDPWNQPDWFEEDFHQGTNREIAYRFFVIACQPHFKKIIDSILHSKGAVLIHCHAGKDRTGLVIGAIQLLLGCKEENIIKDYMASGSDVDLKVFNILFEEVNRLGGIQQFFDYQGVSIKEQELLIKKLKN